MPSGRQPVRPRTAAEQGRDARRAVLERQRRADKKDKVDSLKKRLRDSGFVSNRGSNFTEEQAVENTTDLLERLQQDNMRLDNQLRHLQQLHGYAPTNVLPATVVSASLDAIPQPSTLNVTNPAHPVSRNLGHINFQQPSAPDGTSSASRAPENQEPINLQQPSVPGITSSAWSVPANQQPTNVQQLPLPDFTFSANQVSEDLEHFHIQQPSAVDNAPFARPSPENQNNFNGWGPFASAQVWAPNQSAEIQDFGYLSANNASATLLERPDVDMEFGTINPALLSPERPYEFEPAEETRPLDFTARIGNLVITNLFGLGDQVPPLAPTEVVNNQQYDQFNLRDHNYVNWDAIGL